MLAYQLDKQLSGEKILTDIQQLVHKNVTDSNKKYMLVVRVQEINYESTAHILKIENKNPFDLDDSMVK